MHLPDLTLSCAALITSAGLLMDIIGVTLIFFFGIAPQVRPGGSTYLTVGSDPKEATKASRYKRLGQLGLLLIILGFGAQIFGSFL